MLALALSLSFLLHLFTTTADVAATSAYTPTDIIFLNCGSQSNATDDSHRNWNADDPSIYGPANVATASLSSEATEQHPSVSRVPYMTARVFQSPFTYSFPVLPGPKFLRLYFYPAKYSGGHDKNESFFTVAANEFTLLSNFSPYLTSIASEKRSFVKEFIINVKNNQRLGVKFSPSSNSYAFINGIEIVSVPEALYFRGNDVPIKFVNQLFYLQNTTALETLYRLNVGGSDVEAGDDSGMFRVWSQDDEYIYGDDFGYTPHANVSIKYTRIPAYAAPEIVYTTSRVMANESSRLEWNFVVDSGFYYLVRFHFCEIQLEVTLQNERVFTIYVNKQIAEIEADVIFWTDGPEIPIFRDYLAWISNDGRHGKRDLRISLVPNPSVRPKYLNVLLNGLEIFKLSDSNRSLAAAHPEYKQPSSPLEPDEKPLEKRSKGSSLLYMVVWSVTGVLVLLSFVCFLIFQMRWRGNDSRVANLKGQISPQCVSKYNEIATKSSRYGKIESQTTSGMTCSLEYAMQLEEAAANRDGGMPVDDCGFAVSPSHPFLGHEAQANHHRC